jgi:hypothetical protein
VRKCALRLRGGFERGRGGFERGRRTGPTYRGRSLSCSLIKSNRASRVQVAGGGKASGAGPRGAWPTGSCSIGPDKFRPGERGPLRRRSVPPVHPRTACMPGSNRAEAPSSLTCHPPLVASSRPDRTELGQCVRGRPVSRPPPCCRAANLVGWEKNRAVGATS